MAGGKGSWNGSCNGHEGGATEMARGFGGLGADHLRKNAEMNGGVSHDLVALGLEGKQTRRETGSIAFSEVAPVQTLDSEGPNADLEVQAAVEAILRALGENTSREGLIKTPLRVANAFKSAVQGLHSATESPKAILRSALFSEEGSRGAFGQGGGTGGTVLIRDIECFSTCAECLLPLRLHCHVAYVPQRDCVVGISKLPRAALAVARRLQSPQGFVAELCSAVDAAFTPAGVAVVAEAFHLVNLEHSVTATGMDQGLPYSTQGAHPSPVKPNGFMNGNGHVRVTEADSGPDGLHRCPHLTSSHGGRGDDGSGEGPGWAKTGMAGSHLLAAATGCLGAEESFEELLLMLGLARADVSLMLHRQGAPWQLSLQGLKGAGSEKGCIRDYPLGRVDEQLLPALFRRLLAAEGTEATAQAGNYLAKPEGWQAGALGAARVLSAFCSQEPRQPCREEPGSEPHEGGSKALAGGVEGPARRYLAYLMAATVGSGISQETLLGFLAAHGGSGGRREDYANGLASAASQGNGEALVTRSGSLQGARHKQVQFGNRSICYHQLQISSLCEHHLLPFFGQLKVWYVSPSVVAQGQSHGSVVEPAVLECIALTFSRRLQVQERLTRQVAEAVGSFLGGCGAMAVIEASHLCMSVRGVERPGASTSSISTLGCFSSEPRLRAFCLGMR